MNDTLNTNDINKLLVDASIAELNSDPKYAAARDLFYKFLLEIKVTGVEVTYGSIFDKIEELKAKTTGYRPKM